MYLKHATICIVENLDFDPVIFLQSLDLDVL